MMRLQRWTRGVLAVTVLGGLATGSALLAQVSGSQVEARPFDRPPAVPGPEDRQIAVGASFLDMEGLSWREAVGTRLHLVSQEGGTTVWTVADESVPEQLLRLASHATQAPKVTTFDPGSVSITNEAHAKYVAALTRARGDGGGKAFLPEVKTLDHGTRVMLDASSRPEGIVLKGSLKDRHLLAFHNARVPFDPPGTEMNLNGTIQVPEVASGLVEGEWHVAHEGGLIVSLGTYRKAGRFGFATLRERLVVIQPRRIVLEPEEAALRRPLGTTPPGAG